MRYTDAAIMEKATYIDRAVLAGATIEQELQRKLLALSWDRGFMPISLRGRLIFGAHGFRVPERTRLRFQAIERSKHESTMLALAMPDGGRARTVIQDYADEWLEYRTTEEIIAGATRPGVRERCIARGTTVELELARTLATPRLLFIEPYNDQFHDIEVEAPAGRVLICLTSRGGRPHGNAAMYVERTGDDDYVFECSHAEAPEPNFRGYVCTMAIRPNEDPLPTHSGGR